MVKIVGQFVQATSNAGSDKKLNALKTMEFILARNELAKKNQAEGQTTGSETAPAESVTAEPPVEQARLAEPIRLTKAELLKDKKCPGSKFGVKNVRMHDSL